MTEHHRPHVEPNEADTQADAWAALSLVLILVATAIWFVSNQ